MQNATGAPHDFRTLLGHDGPMTTAIEYPNAQIGLGLDNLRGQTGLADTKLFRRHSKAGGVGDGNDVFELSEGWTH
ncbi:hypothetical protein NBRC116590_00960 [Pelagimonas sp. KU-00592-HH]